MSDHGPKMMEDYVIAMIRLALIQVPNFGSIGFTFIYHDGDIVRIETLRSEQHKRPRDGEYASCQD